MALKKESSVLAGLAVGAVVFAIHSNFTPSVADIQALPAGLPDIDTSERKATWLSAGVVATISLLAKDPTIFIIGSGITVAMAVITRHANHNVSNGDTHLNAASASSATPDSPVTMISADDVGMTEPYEVFDEFAR